MGIRLIRSEHIDLIFSTSPPQSGHLIAYRLQKQTGIPWVADYRDDPTGCDDLTMPTRFHQTAARWMTRRIAGQMRSVVAVSEPILGTIRDLTGVRDCCVIPNGYDREDFKDSTSKRNDKFTLTYSGTLNVLIRPDALFRAIQTLLHTYPRIRSRISIRIVGCAIGFNLRSLVDQFGLGDVVECVGYMNHRESIREMCSADMLLLLLSPRMGEGMVTGKIFEYLAAGRPVLAVVPNGEARNLILRHARGIAIHPDDADGMIRHIKRSYDLWLRGDLALSVPRWKHLSIYDRAHQTRRLAHVFDEACRPADF